MATTGTLLLEDWNARSIWLMGVFAVLFTVGFLMAWARYEIIRENIEWVKDLQVRGEADGKKNTSQIMKMSGF